MMRALHYLMSVLHNIFEILVLPIQILTFFSYMIYRVGWKIFYEYLCWSATVRPQKGPRIVHTSS